MKSISRRLSGVDTSTLPVIAAPRSHRCDSTSRVRPLEVTSRARGPVVEGMTALITATCRTSEGRHALAQP